MTAVFELWSTVPSVAQVILTMRKCARSVEPRSTLQARTGTIDGWRTSAALESLEEARSLV